MTLSVAFHDSLTQQRLGTLPMTKFGFNDPLDKPGSFSAVIPIGIDANVQQIRRLTKKDAVAVYIQDDDTYLWGGPISSHPVWNPSSSTITISAAKWRSYLYSLYYPNGYRSGATLLDQFAIMSDMLNKAMVGKGTQTYGLPKIVNTGDLSGFQRKNVLYQNFANVGDSMDAFSNRDNGFEWDLLVRGNSRDGTPEIYLQKWKGERGYGDNLALSYAADPQASGRAGNILSYAPEPSGYSTNRVWAIGAGQAPDQSWSMDEDPALVDGFMMLRESTRSFSQTTDPATLFEYARGDRLSKQAELGGMSVDIDPDSYRLKDYSTGARTRLAIKDAWYDLDLPAVRIVDRTVNWDNKEGWDITLSLDLDDSEEPQEEEASV